MSADPATVHGLRSLNAYSYVEGRPVVAVDPQGALPFLAVLAVGVVVGAAISGGTSAAVQYATSGAVDWGWKGVLGAAAAGGVGGAVTAGLGAIGGGIWAGAAGGAASSATNAAAAGQSVGGVIAAGLLGGVGGLAAAGISGSVNDGLLLALEPTGISLSAAVHVSAAASSLVAGTAMALAAEGVRDFADSNYRANYANAAGVGAAYGAAGYIGDLSSGALSEPGPAFDKAEQATRYGNWHNQAEANIRSSNGMAIREVGSVQYEWGGRYYSSNNVVSNSGEGISEEQVLSEAWVPSGGTISGYSHAHPPPTVIKRTFGAADRSYRGFGGFHPGDKGVMDASWKDAGSPYTWVEGISTPEGRLEFYYPRTGQSHEQPRLRGLPSYR